ncbi:MAG: hypothetical protein SFZ02_08170 [bacterium]|nr:hypothetical protein [bacterium]
MKTITLRYQNGHFIPIGEVPPIAERHEVVITLLDTSINWDAYIEMLDKTEGMWTDIGQELEDTINEARQGWDEEWQKRLNSL